MADNKVGELRRSAVIMTYSPGAVADMRAENGAPVSGVTAGLEDWDRYAPLIHNLKYQKITERRLCIKLGKRYFRLPPVLEKNAKKPDGSVDESSLILNRFPKWLQCPRCEILRPSRSWASEPGRAYRYCPECSATLPGGKKEYVVPVRFIAACENGHLDEFPWNWWIPHKKNCSQKDKLKLSSVGPGIAGLIVQCLSCKESRSLDGSFGKHALDGLLCHGNQPWLGNSVPECGCSGKEGNYRVLQRGASNLYYPVMESALDIPPWTNRLEAELGDYWDDLEAIDSLEDRIKYIEINPNLKMVADRLGLSSKDMAERFEQRQDDLGALNTDNLKIDEYKVFTGGCDEDDPEFEIRNEPVPSEAKSYLGQVVRVSRLREVRVTRGFTRIKPPFDPDAPEVAAISKESLPWLPAIEVRGEGIFIQFDLDRLLRWEKQFEDFENERIRSIQKSWKHEWETRYPGKEMPFKITPRFILIHSFAHAIIHQLTLECGYSSASLRERLYAEDDMAGLLIYTSTPDSDGTLGGLQRRAEPELLGPTIAEAIKAIQWCSSDPLCITGEITSPEYHSFASCHSCLMVPETSCEHLNRFLDRALLVGVPGKTSLGYFSGMEGMK